MHVHDTVNTNNSFIKPHPTNTRRRLNSKKKTVVLYSHWTKILSVLYVYLLLEKSLALLV